MHPLVVSILLASVTAQICLELCHASGSSLIRIAKETEISEENYCQANGNDISTFRAAVYEHLRLDSSLPKGDWKERIRVNIEALSKVAKLAAQNGAKIIVFPEDGILIDSRGNLDKALPELPDPNLLDETNNNPCVHQSRYPDDTFTILKNLSCIARENDLYVVANFGSRQTCDKLIEKNCPELGYFAFNTDVVLKSDGTFLKRYRKYNLFVEVFDKPPSLETVYFDTPFGRFGIFTCFDMMFKQPAIDLIEKEKVDTVLFPTWWYDELPILSAIQFQDGWSFRHKINLLASNIFNPKLGSIGSGIYSSDNNILYVGSNATGPKLLIATIPKSSKEEADNCKYDFNPLILDIPTTQPIDQYLHKNYTIMSNDSIYVIDKMEEENKVICSEGEQFCCTISYKIDASIENVHDKLSAKKVIMIVRNNLRPGVFNWYEQVCTVATLVDMYNSDELNLIQYSTEEYLRFDKLQLTASFSTKYVYPIAAHSTPELIERNERNFTCDQNNLCTFAYISQTNARNMKAINSFGMYGRLYERDKMPKGW